MNDSVALVVALEAQQATLAVLADRVEQGRLSLYRDRGGHSGWGWEGPAHDAYLIALRLFSLDLGAAVQALTAARDQTAMAAHTLGGRG